MLNYVGDIVLNQSPQCMCLILLINEFCILQRGETALILASYYKKLETVSLLLKAGAKTDIQEKVAIVQSAFD